MISQFETGVFPHFWGTAESVNKLWPGNDVVCQLQPVEPQREHRYNCVCVIHEQSYLTDCLVLDSILQKKINPKVIDFIAHIDIQQKMHFTTANLGPYEII